MEQTYCIYKITNQINGKGYVGFTKNFVKRMWGHQNTAQKGKGQAIHAAIRKYGWNSFLREELYYSKDKQHTLEMEDVFINLYETKGIKGYNISRGGQQGLLKGHQRKPMTSDQLQRLRNRMKDSAIRQKISKGLRGNHNKLGWISTEITKAKQSAALKGHRGRLYSEDERKKQSEKLKGNTNATGYKHTFEWKQKISNFMKQRDHSYKKQPMSSERKTKISESLRILWAERRLRKEAIK